MVTRTIGPKDASHPAARAEPTPPRGSSGSLDGVFTDTGLALVMTGQPRTHTFLQAPPSRHEIAQMHRRKRELLQEIFDRFERRHRNDARAPEIEVRRRILEEIDQRWHRLAAEGSGAEALAFVQAMLGAFNRRGARLRAAPPTPAAAVPAAAPAHDCSVGAPEAHGNDSLAMREPRFAYANMFQVVFHGRAGDTHERLDVSYAYMDPLFDIVSRAARDGAGRDPPRLAREWLHGDGWTQSHDPTPLRAQDARELVAALAAVTRSDFDASHPADYVDDCLRCAAAIGAFIARQLDAGRELQIQNV